VRQSDAASVVCAPLAVRTERTELDSAINRVQEALAHALCMAVAEKELAVADQLFDIIKLSRKLPSCATPT
jgi:hypothetical protein